MFTAKKAEHRRIRCSASSALRGSSGGTKEVDKRKGTIGRKARGGKIKKAKAKEEEEEEKEVESGSRIDGGETVRKNERV